MNASPFCQRDVQLRAQDQRQHDHHRHVEDQVDHLAGHLGGQRVVDRRQRAQQHAVHLPVADQVAHRPVGLRVGDLVDQDQDQVVGHELAAASARRWLPAPAAVDQTNR